jgi:hypothetical protein
MVVVDYPERIAALRLFAPHYWVALEDEGAALGVVTNSGKRTLCLFKSREDAEEFVAGAGVEGRYTIREMITTGDMAALFGSPNGQTYTHITVNPPWPAPGAIRRNPRPGPPCRGSRSVAHRLHPPRLDTARRSDSPQHTPRLPAA